MPETDNTSLSEQQAAAIFSRAEQRAKDARLSCAGALTPKEAWLLLSSQKAALVDVRTPEEFKFVGHIPHAILIPFKLGTAMAPNPAFMDTVKQQFAPDSTLMLLCRSDRRSKIAAELLTDAGFTRVYDILEGFEGAIDENRQRGHIDGWQFRKLPWAQD